MIAPSRRRVALGLSLFMTLGCASLEPGPALQRRAVTRASVSAEPSATMITGHVDLSEPPYVVDPSGPIRARSLAPSPLLAATEVASWLPPDHTGASVEIELRNLCSLGFDYDFASGQAPTAAAEHPRRSLDPHTLELQRVVEGQWLRLWDGERWLGSAMTTVDGGRMEISPWCDTLEVRFELHGRGSSSFAIHWEIDADQSLAGATSSSAELISVEQDRPEPWGPDLRRIELRLVNLCAESVDYTFTPDPDGEPERTASVAGHSERRVAIPAGWWLRFRALDDSWRGGAMTSHDGGVVWIASNCVDFGVADGRVVRP